MFPLIVQRFKKAVGKSRGFRQPLRKLACCTQESDSLVTPKVSSSQKARIVVSVINYKTADLTIQCTQSVLDALGSIDGHVVIVDNKSDDGSVNRISDWIRENGCGDRVHLVASPTNSGFSGGHNQGMGARPADYFLILNSDAIVRPDFFEKILDQAELEPEYGLFAPRIDYDDGGQQISCFRFPTPTSEIIRGAESNPVTRLLGKRRVALEMPPNPDQIQWASFACILLRAEMVAQVGPMDEGYFLYFEDVEYCWRARQAGWHIRYVPEARAVHFRGGSGPVKSLAKAKKRLPAYYYASRTRIFYQMYGTGGLLLANLGWLVGRTIAAMRVLAGKNIPASNQQEYRDIWINVFSPLGDSHQTKN